MDTPKSIAYTVVNPEINSITLQVKDRQDIKVHFNLDTMSAEELTDYSAGVIKLSHDTCAHLESAAVKAGVSLEDFRAAVREKTVGPEGDNLQRR